MIRKFEMAVDRLYDKLDILYHKFHIVFDILFYSCFVLFLTYSVICNTTRKFWGKVLLKPFVEILALRLDWVLLPALAALALLFDFKEKKIRLIAFFSLFILMLYQVTADNQIVWLIPHCNFFYFGGACLVVAAKGRNFRNIAWTYVITAATLMVSITILSVIGIIPDEVVNLAWRSNRHALGMSYAINYSGHWIPIMLVYCYLKNGFMKIWDYIAGIVVLCISLFLCKAMTDSAVMILLLTGTLYRQICYSRGRRRLFADKKKNLVLIRGMEWSFVILAAFMIIGALLYVPPISTFVQNSVLFTIGDRFKYGRIGLLNFFPSLLGIDYPTSDGPDYFWIDCSYIRILLKCGVIIFVIVLVTLYAINRKAVKSQQIYALCLMTLIAIVSAMEHHLPELYFDPFLLMLFAVISPKKAKEQRVSGE